jgi:hypothetical protein
MPERVILGIIDDDVRRTMCVYGFLCFPGFGMPFAKPRLALTEHGFAPVNLPLPQPEWMFTRRSITELPFLEIDGAFQPSEWTWHVYHHSYAIRLLLSRYPPWSATRAGLTADVTARLNGAILREFVRLARMRGSVPIVVFFPARSSFTHTAASPARQALRMARVRFLDMTDCVAAVEPRERFVALHYSAVTNAAVALCLRDAIDAGFESGGEDGRG